MLPIVTDRVAWSVCLSVGRSVCHNREPYKNGWTDRDAVWAVGSYGLTESCIRWGSDPRWHEAILRGKGRPAVKYSDSVPWAVQKWLNRSGCRLGFGFGWAQESMYWVGCTLAQPSEYKWTVHVLRRCGLLSNYFDHLFYCPAAMPKTISATTAMLGCRNHSPFAPVRPKHAMYSRLFEAKASWISKMNIIEYRRILYLCLWLAEICTVVSIHATFQPAVAAAIALSVRCVIVAHKLHITSYNNHNEYDMIIIRPNM